MNPNDINDSAYLYDTQLIGIDQPNKALIFHGHGTHRIAVANTTYWHVGDVGRLRLPAPDRTFAFHVYPDRRLRRLPSLDNADRGVWGWRLDERRICIKVGIIPGKDGAFVPRDTEFLEIELPREFLKLAADCGLRPDRIIKDFVANLCGLMNFFSCPREDEYSSSGSDERDFAKEYFRRTYGWLFF